MTMQVSYRGKSDASLPFTDEWVKSSSIEQLRSHFHQLLLSGDEESLAELLLDASHDEINALDFDIRLTANILIDADNHFLRLFGGAYLDKENGQAKLPFGQHVFELVDTEIHHIR